MKTVRLALSVLSVLSLLVGYLASQAAALNGTAGDYAQKVDAAPVRTMALVILIAALVCAVVPDRGEDP